jgi:hypothetical protein
MSFSATTIIKPRIFVNKAFVNKKANAVRVTHCLPVNAAKASYVGFVAFSPASQNLRGLSWDLSLGFWLQGTRGLTPTEIKIPGNRGF